MRIATTAAACVEAVSRNASFDVEGTGAGLELAITELVLTPTAPQGGGTLTAGGSVSLQNRTANLAVTANDFDPAWLVAAWPGRLTGSAQLRAAAEPEPNGALEAIDLVGSLRGYRVSLRGAAALTGRDAVRLDELRLESGDNYVLLTGALDDTRLDVTVDAELAAIDLLVPDAAGSLTADVTLGGTWQEPRGSGRIGLRDVAFAGIAVERIDVNGEAGLAPDARVALTVEAAGLARGPLRVADLRVVAAGTTAAHTLRVDAGAEELRGTVAAAGGIRDGAWRGMIEQYRRGRAALGAVAARRTGRVRRRPQAS